LPLGRSAEAIALLAPGVVNNGGSFRNGPLGGSIPSFGGSAASENAYYLNGFNTTATANNLGGLTLPYGAIDQQEIFTGGYGAQFGRSNGGVINQIGKRGSNRCISAWQRHSNPMRSRPARRTCTGGLTASPPPSATPHKYAKSANGLYQPLSENRATSNTYSAYVGGPIIQDRLFFFAAAEKVDSHGTSIDTNRDIDLGKSYGQTDYEYTQKRWYGKLDWYITDNHILEVTGASDKYKTNGKVYNYDYINRTRGAYRTNEDENKAGPTLYSAKYTGYFGDNITVSALYGEMKTPDEVTPYNYSAANGPLIGGTALQNPAYTGGTPIEGAQKVTTIYDPDREYEKRNLRLNLEWRIGDHAISFGVDNQNLKATNTGTVASGPGYAWNYGKTADPMARHRARTV
jgi:hypothetical protein